MSTTEVEALCLRFYGRKARASALRGERDQNFCMHADGEQFVLKLHHPDEDPAGLNFQTVALRHLEGLAVPRVISTLDGVDIQRLPDGRRLRMLSWLDGVFLQQDIVNDELRERLGRMLAHLDMALANFSHPASCRPLLWDIQQVGAIRPLLIHHKDPDVRRLAKHRLDHWEQLMAPWQKTLPWQVIHNDANPGNVLIQGDSIGVLDFGDMISAPRVQEIAVACSYYLGDEPLLAMHRIAQAYHDVFPLLPEEWEMLPEMVGIRAAMSVTIGAYRMHLSGEDPAHFATSCATLRWLEKNPNASKLVRNP